MTNSLAHFAFAALLIATAGCSDASGPARLSEHAVLNRSGPIEFIGSPGEQLDVLPAVQVYDNRNGRPLANVGVRFTSSGGPLLDYATKTGADGIAHLNSLKLNSTPLKYTITATADGIGSVDFTAIAASSEPQTAQPGDTSDWKANATVISVTRGSAAACGWGTSAGDTRNQVAWRITVKGDAISLDEDMRNWPTDDVPYSGHLAGRQFSATYKSGSDYASYVCQFREAAISGTFTSDSTFEADETLYWGIPGSDTSVKRHWSGSRN